MLVVVRVPKRCPTPDLDLHPYVNGVTSKVTKVTSKTNRVVEGHPESPISHPRKNYPVILEIQEKGMKHYPVIVGI